MLNVLIKLSCGIYTKNIELIFMYPGILRSEYWINTAVTLIMIVRPYHSLKFVSKQVSVHSLSLFHLVYWSFDIFGEDNYFSE